MQSYHAIFPGGLVAPNRNAVDWGQQGLLAYGACNYVVVADVIHTMKRIQTLDGHSRAVTKLRWAREPLQFRNESNYSLTLASGDEGGSILVWKVTEATILASLNPGTYGQLAEEGGEVTRETCRLQEVFNSNHFALLLLFCDQMEPKS